MKTIIVYIALLFSSLHIFSQEFFTHEETGNWLTPQIWINEDMPALGNSNNQNIHINGTITYYGTIELKNNNTITINSEDTLIVTEDFILQNNSEVIVNGNGVFLVFGNFESNRNLNIETGGILTVFGNFITESLTLDITPDGHMYVLGDSDVNKADNDIEDLETFINNEFELVNWVEENYNITLPVELSSFTVTQNREDITINWTTESETNNEFFTIEYSTNGIDFVPIETIDGQGSTSIQNMYSYVYTINETYNNTILYFRLKQTDYNGIYSYSNIISHSVENKHANITVYPNPASDYISVSTQQDNILSITIQNRYGQIELQTYSGEKIDVRNLSPGTYIVTINTQNNRTQKLFVKK
ncbi:MAG: T9SS type A sorting domain-containing protein [Bacteroidales bacterium]